VIAQNLKRLLGLSRCFYRPRRRTAVAPIPLIASVFSSLPDDLAAVVMLSLTGLDISLWLVSRGWLAALT